MERERQQTGSGNKRKVPDRGSFSISACAWIISLFPPHSEAPLFSLTAPVSTGSEVTSPVTSVCQACRRQLYVPLLILWPTTHNHPPLVPQSILKCPSPAPAPLGRWTPYQRLVVNLLSDELVLAERVAGLSSDGVNGAFLHLLLDGTEEGEERLACTLLQNDVRERKKVWGEENFEVISAVGGV